MILSLGQTIVRLRWNSPAAFSSCGVHGRGIRSKVKVFFSTSSSSTEDMISNLFKNDDTNGGQGTANQDSNNIDNMQPQSVAVIGSGAIGSYYGARLWEAGHRVQFYLRPSPSFDKVQQQGMRIQSVDGDLVIPPQELELFDSTERMDTPDWILVALKSTAMTAIPNLIMPLLSPNAKILVLMNGLVDEDLVRLLKRATGQATTTTTTTADDEPLTCCRTLYGGLAFIAANRVGPGEVHHLYAGTIAAGVASSASSHPDDNNTTTAAAPRDELEALWQPVPTVPCQWEASLRTGRWRKMLWNVPFNGIGVAMGGLTTDEIVNDPGLRALARKVMEETLAVAQAECGSEVLTESMIDNIIALTESMTVSYQTSTLIDLLERRPMEVEYIFRKPLQRAQALGIDTPHLYTIVTMIEAWQRRYDLF